VEEYDAALRAATEAALLEAAGSGLRDVLERLLAPGSAWQDEVGRGRRRRRRWRRRRWWWWLWWLRRRRRGGSVIKERKRQAKSGSGRMAASARGKPSRVAAGWQLAQEASQVG